MPSQRSVCASVCDCTAQTQHFVCASVCDCAAQTQHFDVQQKVREVCVPRCVTAQLKRNTLCVQQRVRSLQTLPCSAQTKLKTGEIRGQGKPQGT